MKIHVVLTFLLIVILKANALDSSTKNQNMSSIKDGMDALSNDVAYIFGSPTERGGIQFQLENKQFKCKILNTLSARNHYPHLHYELLSDRMVNMLDNCPAQDFQIADFFNQPFIFPGTNWCGHGDVIKKHHNLGIFNATDSCCREYDHCDDIIKPGRVKHHLYNIYTTTRLHCKCDEALRTCLKKVDTMVSNIVGYLLFSVTQTQCFDYKHPATECLFWKRGAVKQYCVKYQYQEDQHKKWQWFDKKPFV